MLGAFAGAPVSFAEPLGGAGTYGDPFGGPGSFGSPFGPSTGFGDSQAGGLLGQFSPMESFIPGSGCLLYTSPSPRDRTRSRMPSSA